MTVRLECVDIFRKQAGAADVTFLLGFVKQSAEACQAYKRKLETLAAVILVSSIFIVSTIDSTRNSFVSDAIVSGCPAAFRGLHACTVCPGAC